MNKYPKTSSVWLYGGALILVLVVAAYGLFFSLSRYFNQGELGTKSYYASLQGVEFENRSNKDQSFILKANVDGAGLDMLGILGADAAKTRVWIILNKTSPEGRPLSMPQGIPIKVDCNFINSVISHRQVAEPVRRYLLKECTHQ